MKNSFIQGFQKRFGRLFSYVSLVLVVLMLISVARNIGRVFSIRNEVERQRQKIEKLEKENIRVQGEISKAQVPEFIERQVRDKLGLVKEGETVVVLPDEETLRRLAPKVSIEEDYLPDPNWKKWFKLFI